MRPQCEKIPIMLQTTNGYNWPCGVQEVKNVKL